jgi:hypothetical protein
VCGILRSALNASGATWGAFTKQDGPANDVDAVATDDNGENMQVQVVRVERTAWKDLGRVGHATAASPPDELATAILQAVEKKMTVYPRAQRQGLLLALDAIRAPGYSLQHVRDYVVTNHAETITGYEFKEIWLVGPTAALTYRLA